MDDSRLLRFGKVTIGSCRVERYPIFGACQIQSQISFSVSLQSYSVTVERGMNTLIFSFFSHRHPAPTPPSASIVIRCMI